MEQWCVLYVFLYTYSYDIKKKLKQVYAMVFNLKIASV